MGAILVLASVLSPLMGILVQWAWIFSAISQEDAKQDYNRTEPLGRPGDAGFTDIPNPAAMLIGFNVVVEKQGRYPQSIQPLYKRGNSIVEGKWYGPRRADAEPVQLIAKDGYAVGAISGKVGSWIDSFWLTYMKIKGKTLDNSDIYESQHVGGTANTKQIVIDSQGFVVVGVWGKTGAYVDRIGFILSARGDQLIIPGQESPDKRIPVPDSSAQKQSEKVIRDLFKEEYSKRAPADQQALAKKLLQQGRDTKDDPAVRYVLFREGMDLAAKSGDVSTALGAAEEIGKLYEVDGLALKTQALTATAGAAKSREAATALAEACLQVAEEAAAADKFREAKVLAGKAEAAARVAKDAALVKRVQKRGDEIEDLEREQRKVKEAEKVLETNPNDPDANLALGRYALLKGELEKALPMLSRGSEPLLRAAADKELATPTEAKGQAEVGDAWWDVAEKEKSAALKEAFLGRAKENYEKALAGLSGFGKTRVEKRLAELSAVKASPKPGSTGGTKPQLTLDLGGGVKMEFVYIKPGVFTMGGTEAPTEVWQGDERPPHLVRLTGGFYIGKYEVTQAQWEAVMGSNPSHYKGPDLPVNMVSWQNCQDFLKKLNENTRSQLKGHVVMLPTEAQWEYACRAGTTTKWSFGEDESALGEHGWYSGNSGGRPHPVGQKKPNPWGLYDMHGNVWEWCQDWYGPYGGDVSDPEGPSSGQERCLRGGGWYKDPSLYSRSAFRRIAVPHYRGGWHFGFRACLR
jgi:formylglycine-generating enzyme required for sulfatase activity